MKVLVAGATGAIGQPIVRQLAEKGHDVIAVSRTAQTRSRHAKSVACDVLDATMVDAIVKEHRPDAVVAELTNLPKKFSPRALRSAYPANNRVRLDGTRNLLRAAEKHAVKRFIAQSSGFWYAPTPGMVKRETDPLWKDAPEPMGGAVRACVEMEDLVRASRGPKTVLLRYAGFYGPGTWFSPDGTVGTMVKKRRFPIIGKGDEVVSFVHIDDAASATVAAVDASASGTFNVADDEPAPTREWLPYFAKTLGAKAPRHVPPWVAKLVVGPSLTKYTVNSRGADNSAAKTTLRWKPRYPSWRQGFAALSAGTSPTQTDRP